MPRNACTTSVVDNDDGGVVVAVGDGDDCGAIMNVVNSIARGSAASTRVWASDAIISRMDGIFRQFQCFADLPRSMRAAPDATTWAGVQLWQWWSSPDVDAVDGRLVSRSRQCSIWTVLHAACRAAEEESLPELEPELWLLVFTFVRH